MISELAATIPTPLDRAGLVAWYNANRARSASIFGLIDPAGFYEAPIPLRHPFVFYVGHLPAFSFLTLVRDALRRPSIDRPLEDLFNRGIDPDSLAAAEEHRRKAWPSLEAVADFARRCDEAVIDALLHAKLDDPGVPNLVRAQAAYNILEHEEMHHETLLYIVHQLPEGSNRAPLPEVRDVMPPPREPVAIAAGTATLGARRDGIAFGWDNEFEETQVAVGAFGVDVYDVTNERYRAFVDAGGPVPPFWVERDGAWGLRVLGGVIPLPASWPVYCSNDQAAQFAAWSGARLMTEAEYHRAAYGTPAGEERAQPWGTADAGPTRGNFDLRRFDPEPAGSYPAGASAWGVFDLVGNGWEWTSTPFAPFPGFAPMASYPLYSADFFDGEHFVIKGASPVTSRHFVRRSFRNWYRRGYPYMYATFRLAYDR